jgi:hypothetical protein
VLEANPSRLVFKGGIPVIAQYHTRVRLLPSDIYTDFFRIGELKVEEGVVTYKIKDSGGTIASGSLGQVSNPFLQVQYLVLRASRSGGYGLIDLRLDALGLYAGHQTQVEDFEEGDGTVDGVLDSGGYQAASANADEKLDEAHDLITIYWTGWWPLLHFVIGAQIITDVYLEVDLAVDILGGVSLYSFDVQFLDLEDMTEAEADELLGEISPAADSLVGTGPIWSYLFAIGGISYAAARLIAAYANPASLVQEIVIWGLLTVAACCILAGLVLLAEAVAKAWTDPLLGALVFLGFAFGSLSCICVTNKAVNELGTSSAGGAKKFLRFFDSSYLQGGYREDIGFRGRWHVGILLVELMVLGLVLILATGFFTGWIYGWF